MIESSYIVSCQCSKFPVVYRPVNVPVPDLAMPRRSPYVTRQHCRHAISSLLASTPRSRSTRSRLGLRSSIRKISVDASTDTADDAMMQACNCVDSSLWAPIIENVSRQSLKYRVLSQEAGSLGWLEVTQSSCSYINDVGPVDVVRMVVSYSLLYQIDVTFPVFRNVARLKGIVPTEPQKIKELLDIVDGTSGYTLCRGLQLELCEEQLHGNDHKLIRVFSFPTKRYESENCLLWHQPNNFLHNTIDDPLYNVCSECKTEAKRIGKNSKRAKKVDPKVKSARQNPSSNYPISRLSPNSKVIRMKRTKNERDVNKKKVSQYLEQYNADLSENDSSDMTDFIHHVESSPEAQSQLQSLLSEITDPQKRSMLETAWENDCRQIAECSQFLKDQEKCRTGHHGNRWSIVTYRLALAIFTRSPCAFDAVKSLNILQLPSRKSLQSFTSANIQKPGVSPEYLCEQMKAYLAHCEQVSGPKPVFEGILIFDEVKVQNRVCWHTRTNRIVGLAMTPDDLATLGDVYKCNKEDDTIEAEKTTYVLQFLWRDLSSDFDLVGPYFTSQSGLDSRFTLACVYDTMQALESVGFKVKGLLCDGASWNLSLLKKLCSESSSHACFTSPFSDEKCWVIVCPSHQLKNMVSALHSSKCGSSKNFCNEGIPFGWVTIERVWQREIDRAQSGRMSEVPKLQERHILRDSWTKLNVSPAKIMQQDHIIAEIEKYGANSSGDHMALQYLKSLNLMFERGFLCAHQINSTESPVLQRIEKGFNFFKHWQDDVTVNGVKTRDPQQSAFLAWQTWDLLELMYCGFVGLCSDFLSRHGQSNHYIIPVRVNGSAIESLFSRFKYNADGNLSAVNYETALSRLLTANSVQSSGKDNTYRNMHLDIHGQLKRKGQ